MKSYIKNNFKLISYCISFILVFTLLIPIAAVAVVDGTSIENPGAMPKENIATPIDTASTTSVKLIAEPILFKNLNYEVFYTIEDCNNFISVVEDRLAFLAIEIQSDKYTSEAKLAMQEEQTRLSEEQRKGQANSDKLSLWASEYEEATFVWQFFRQHGFSNEVTCAIIANMMVETAGGTLKVNPIVYDSTGGYYGLCQWSIHYNPSIANKNINEQLEYLLKTLEYEFNTFGSYYKAGFKYTDFINMSDPGQAAIAFAKVYERCAAFSYDKREACASIAISYFNLDM